MTQCLRAKNLPFVEKTYLMKRFPYPPAVAIVLALAVGACGSTKSASSPKSPSQPASGPSSSNGNVGAQPIGSSTGSGNVVALAKSGGRRVAFVADEDAKAILTIDIDSKQQLAETKVGGSPSQVYVAKDGRVFATVRDTNKLIAFKVDHVDGPLLQTSETSTPAEPVSIATTPDEKMIVVGTGWGQKLAAFDSAPGLAHRFEAKLPREPRSVVVSDDGKTAFVSHAVGSIVSGVDLVGAKHGTWVIPMRGKNAQAVAMAANARRMAELSKKSAASPSNKSLQQAIELQFSNALAQEKRALEGRQSCQGFVLAKSTAAPNRIFAPQVMVDPGDPERRPTGYGDSAQIPEVPAVAVIDEGAAEALPSSMNVSGRPPHFSFGVDRFAAGGECLLPRSAAVDPTSKSLLVTCFGIDAVVAYDAMSGTPSQAVRRHWNVGAGPTGIAVDAEKRQAVVFSQFDRTISVFSLGGDDLVDDKGASPTVERTALAPLSSMSPSFVVGRMLFHASGDIRISNDGRACASCHPDGRDDAITWATPEGPRRSIMLAGRVKTTPPYSWDGNASTIEQHLSSTFQRLKGHGLRSFELDSLIAYISGLPAPPARVIDPADKGKIERGRAIFTSAEAGCASCHAGSTFTDGMNHDVGSKHNADRAEKFNTPSLHLVGGTGPYFHDGRYANLNDLLRKSDGKMGHTKHLTNSDLEALQSFIETL